jgi:hypothetical protein
MNDLYKLKISLMSKGVQITPDAYKALVGGENTPLSVFDYVTTSGMVLTIPGNVYVNANFKEECCKRSENMLDFNEKLIIRSPYGEVEVSCMQVPSYYNEMLSSGRPVTEVIMTHADRMRISPIRGCSNRCQFCDMGTAYPYRKTEINEIREALGIALKDQNLTPKHLLISGGTPKKEDEEYLDTIYEQVIKKCPVPVDVMMAPREDESILKRLLEWGCNGLSINMEINDGDLAKKIMPEKYRVGKDRYLKFIEKAVNVFGRGAVRSCVILGLEDAESTLEGVRNLAQIGCDPVLSSFKPLKGTMLEDVSTPESSFQEYVYEEAEKIVREYGVLLGPRCIPCQHNTLAFPVAGENYFFY